MESIEYVSIGGYVFRLEKDAFTEVGQYLENLESFYSKREGGSEVMEGIEERLSELLLDQSGEGGVVTLSMVRSAMESLGKPEAIEEDFTGIREEGRVKKRLCRDMREGKIAGVCSGLGNFFDVDPSIFRLIFVFLSIFGGLFRHSGGKSAVLFAFPLLYIILWICMPVGRTNGQKVKSRFWSGLWRVLEVFTGIVLLLAGVAGITSLGFMSFGDRFFLGSFFYNHLADSSIMLRLMTYYPVVIAFAVAIVIPFIAMIYGGVMLLFNLKAPAWHPGLCLLVTWLVALTILAVLVVLSLVKFHAVI